MKRLSAKAGSLAMTPTIARPSLVGGNRITNSAELCQVPGLEIEHLEYDLRLVPDALFDRLLLGIRGGVDTTDDGGPLPVVGSLQVVHLPFEDPANVALRDERPGGIAEAIPDEVECILDAVHDGHLAGTPLLKQQADPEYDHDGNQSSDEKQSTHGLEPTDRASSRWAAAVRHAGQELESGQPARSYLPGRCLLGGSQYARRRMSFETVSLFFALLAIAANAVTIGIVAIALAGKTSAGAGVRNQVFSAFQGLELWMAFIVAATATLGSLYLSEVAHFIPCMLCWYQRIAMYPIAIILLIAAVRRDHGVRIYAATLAVIGAVISFYHRLIQAYPELEGGGSCDPAAPCTAAYIEQFGFITIPYMALSAFLLILALLWLDRFNKSPGAAQ